MGMPIESFELTIKSHLFTKSTNIHNVFNDLGYDISGSFLVAQLPEEQSLSQNDLKSVNLKILQLEKRPIGDKTYDADDRISFDISNVLKKGFCTYVICFPKLYNSKGLVTDLKSEQQFSFDFIVKKKGTRFRSYSSINVPDDKQIKHNTFFWVFNKLTALIKSIFHGIYNSTSDTKKMSFKMNDSPVVLMKLHYDSNNNVIVSFPIKELRIH